MAFQILSSNHHVLKHPGYASLQGLRADKKSLLVAKRPEHKFARQDRYVPSIKCQISSKEAEKLSRNAILNTPLENKKEIFSKIKAPADILTSNLASAKLLDQINLRADEDTKRINQLKALFLWDKVGQAVVNENLKTWQDKLNCAKQIILCLPEELASLRHVKPSTKGEPLSKHEALILSESILHNKPIEKPEALLNKITTSKDLVKIDLAATKVLAKMNAGKTEEVIRFNNMRYLFLMHKVGVQVTQASLATGSDIKMYAKHMLSGFFNK
jgi:hypothetical protein